jgi:hypothetical protein
MVIPQNYQYESPNLVVTWTASSGRARTFMSSSEDIFHTRGDRASGRGFSYEVLWRARLLISLAKDDVLEIYGGHDIKITRGSGLTEFHQAKYRSSPVRKSDVERLVRDSEQASPNERYFLCTNASLSEATDELIEPLRAKKVLRVDVWTPDPDDATPELDTAVHKRIKHYFTTQDPSDFLAVAQVNEIVDAALSLAMQIGFRADSIQVSGGEVEAAIGLLSVVQSIPARATGGRLLQWDTSRVEQLPFRIRRSVEEACDREITKWLARPTPRLIVVQGISGAGKTSLLAALAGRYSPRASVYWDVPWADQCPPALDQFARWTRGPTIVCVDDFVFNDWSASLRSLRTETSVLVLLATSWTANAHAAKDLDRDNRTTLLALEPTLDHSEQRELLLACRQRDSFRSRREATLLAASTIRRSVRILSELPSNDARQYHKLLGLTDDDDVRPWLMPILIASSVQVALPQSLLFAHLNAPIGKRLPAELEPLLLGHHREGDRYLRIEDASVAVRVLGRIRSQIGPRLDRDIEQEAVRLIKSVVPSQGAHRVFARRLLWAWSTSANDYESFRTSTAPVVEQLLVTETNVGIAMVWLDLLPPEAREHAGQQLIAAFLTPARAPQSVAEVHMLVEVLGPEIARRYAETQLTSGLHWPPRPWADFFAKLGAVPRENIKLLSRHAISVFRSTGLSLTELFAFGNPALMLGLIEDHGAPRDREWALEDMEPWFVSSAQSPALLPAFQKYIRLVERTLMQSRGGASIELVTQALARSATGSFDSLARTAYDRYRELLGRETERALAVRAIELGLSLIRSDIDSTKRTLTLLSQLISFASAWADDALMRRVLDCARAFLLDRPDLVKPAENLILATATESGRRGLTTLDELKACWRLVTAVPESPPAWRLVSWLSVGLLKTGIIEDAALIKRLVSAFAQTRLQAAAQLLPDIFTALGQTDEVSTRALDAMRDCAGELEQRERAVSSVVITAWGGARKLPWTPEEAADIGAAMVRWTETDNAQKYLALTLDTIGAATALAHFVVRAHSTRPKDLDVAAYAAVVAARNGDVELAKKHVGFLLQTFKRTHTGAHPESLARAYAAIAGVCDEAEAIVWKICALLTDQRPLPERISF